MKQSLYYTKINSSEVLKIPDNKLENCLKDKYDFQEGYVPEGYGFALLIIEDNQEDSRKDKWKMVFYKKKTNSSGNITLDNIDELENDNDEYTYEFYKEIDGNFEDVIEVSADLIKKYDSKVMEMA